jgi:hypothetical protein
VINYGNIEIVHCPKNMFKNTNILKEMYKVHIKRQDDRNDRYGKIG